MKLQHFSILFYVILISFVKEIQSFAPIIHPKSTKFGIQQRQTTISPIRISSATSDNVDRSEPEPISRTARITFPLYSLSTALGISSPIVLPVTIFPDPALAAPINLAASFDAAIKEYFPGSLTSSYTSQRVVSELRKRGYLPSNSLLGSSLCSDEINYTPDSLIVQLSQSIGKGKSAVFQLGGLGGLPFVGTSGFGAFLSHCPGEGKILIVFGPHVGIAEDGSVGKVKRNGMENVSTSCGAAVGAYKQILKAAQAMEKEDGTGGSGGGETDDFDMQIQYIVAKLEKKLETLAKDEMKGDDAIISYVTAKMYEIIEELIVRAVKTASSKPGFWNKVSDITLLGGVVINRSLVKGGEGGEDFFQPLMARSYNSQGDTNIYNDIFGSFDTSIQQYFPGSLTNSVASLRVVSALRNRGYRPSNILIGSSLCSDEINYTRESLITKLSKNLGIVKSGGVFQLGGLGGLPFVGSSGFGAFMSHCPKEGKVIILFGPHVGISETGTVGKVKRLGMEKISTSCGASVGAYKQIMSAPKSKSMDRFDLEEQYIITKLEEKLEPLAKNEVKGDDAMISLVTIKMYELIQDLMISGVKSISSKPGFWNKVNEITIVGGIVINRCPSCGEDSFQPLTVRSYSSKGETNIYREIFGDLKTPKKYM